MLLSQQATGTHHTAIGVHFLSFAFIESTVGVVCIESKSSKVPLHAGREQVGWSIWYGNVYSFSGVRFEYC